MGKSPIAFMLLLFTVTASVAFGGQARVKSFSLDLPKGFGGPITQSSGPAEIVAFAKPHEGQETNSLIQFTIVNLQKVPSDADLRSATVTNKKYLMKLIDGIERRRTKFWKGNYREISIAGIPGNKIEWSGNVEEIGMKGVYYTFIFQGYLYAISLQDILPYAEDNLPDMIKAIEAIKQSS